MPRHCKADLKTIQMKLKKQITFCKKNNTCMFDELTHLLTLLSKKLIQKQIKLYILLI